MPWDREAGLGSPVTTLDETKNDAGPRTASLQSRLSHLPALLTPAEAAVLLRTTRAAIYARAERGQLPGVIRDGRRLLIDRDVLVRSLTKKTSDIAEETRR